MIKVLIIHFLIGSAIGNKIIIPILHMPISNVQPFTGSWEKLDPQELIKKFTASHLVELEPAKYNIDKLYVTHIRAIGNILNGEYINIKPPPAASTLSDINYYWSTTIPEIDIKGTELEGVKVQDHSFGKIQELMLINITNKMSIDLSKVALRLGLSVRNLSYSYDPAKWENVVHAMIEEGMQNYRVYLEIASVDKLASLFRLTAIQLKNSTIDDFVSLLPPILPKKVLMDTNITRDILVFLGLAANSSEAILYNMAHRTTKLTVEQFGVLYNLTKEQQRVTERSTLQQMSQACERPMSQLLDKNIPNIVWNTVGDLTRPVSCSPILKVKGVVISSLTGLGNSLGKTALQILLHACNQSWKSCRLTMSLGPSEWECIETLTLQQAVSKLSISRTTLLINPVNDFVATLSSKCKDGSIALTTYRPKSITSLQSLFNLTVKEVETLLGITNSVIESFSLPQYVHAFLNASSIDLGIALNTMYDTTKKTLQQLFDSPIYELYENVPYILRAAVKTPASQLRMSDADTFAILKLSPASSTIAQFKYAVKWVLPAIVRSKNKFENETLGSYLTAYSISDSAVGENTTLSVLLRASGFEVDTMKTIYKLTSAQISVLELLHIKELHKYCGLQLFKLKTKIFFNITATLVGILEISPTCKATNFYVEAKSETVFKLESVCPTIASMSTSLMRIVEDCSGLSWRFSAGIFGVNICDWPQMDVLNKQKLPALSDLSIDTVQQTTLENLLTKANEIHTKNSPSYKTELTTYSGPMRTQLFSTFSTSKIKISHILGITEAAIDGYSLLKIVDKVQESLKVKYTINLSTTASTLGILLKDVKCLAPTEWNEMIPPLKNEIVASGSTQLSVTENSFKLLLQLGDISALKFSQLEVSWDSHFKRILTGKTFSENKTISTIQSIFNINQQSLLQETLLVFYNKHLNLTKAELSVLFGMRFSNLDVLTKFTFKEIPCSCKFSESHLMDQTPYTLLTGMVGHKDITLCRPIALLVAFRFLSINELTLKFTVNFNETETLLIVIQRLSDLPYEKISWGLNAQLSQWPVFASVSLETFANITSTNVTTLKSTPFHNVTEDVLSNKGRFAEQLQDFHNSLLAQASNLFVVPASGVCGQCTILSIDVLITFLWHLGGIVYLDPRVIPYVAGFECITHDVLLLQPSKWHLLIPGIIPKSFGNISATLKISETKLAHILGSSRSSIFNMTLAKYINMTTKRVHPLVQCYKTINTETALSTALAKGATISLMKKQSVIQILTVICSDVNVYNMTAIMGWEDDKLSVLGNYTLEDAAMCKRMSVKSVLSRTLVDLSKMMIDEIHGCVVVPCRAGTTLDQEHYNCSDVNECNETSTCKDDQICQNYFGGHECECTKPGYWAADKVCERIKRFLLEITFDIQFSVDLKNPSTLEYYTLKEKVQKNVDSVFAKVTAIKGYYKGCTVDTFSEGSVVSKVSVYTNQKYSGSAKDMATYFRNGLNKTNGKTYLGSIKVKSNTLTDYNECSQNQVNCHQYATCLNTLGSFSCKCKSGYEGDGINCEAGFLKSYWWLVILLGIILLIIIIVIIVLVIKKPRLKSYGVDEDLPPMHHGSHSSLSYKNGDVFYKDKDGNVREGTEHVSMSPIEHQNPLYGREIPENVYDNSDSQWSHNIYALDNLGSDKPKDDEQPTKSNVDEATVQEDDAAQDHML